MEKIKFIADSGCDITREQADIYDIDILPLKILQGNQIWEDWYDFTPEEFYSRLYKFDDSLPTSSQVTPEEFFGAYKKASDEGFDTVISVSLNEKASGTYQSSLIAKSMFYEKFPENPLKIITVDSQSYSYLIGAVLIEGAKMAKAGAGSEEILSFLKEKYAKVMAYAVVYTLDFLKRSGRINKTAGFVGKLLNIKPIIAIGNGQINAVDKVQGTKRAVGRLLELVEKMMDEKEGEFYIIHGDMPQETEELHALLSEKFASAKIQRASIGSVISIHSGPKLLGLGFYRK